MFLIAFISIHTKALGAAHIQFHMKKLTFFFFLTENKEKDYSAVQKNSSICIFIYELEYLQYKL